MSANPLFVRNRTTLLESLRLKGVDEASSQQIDDAINEIRLGFYDRLGEARIALIRASDEKDSPETTADRLRTKAAICERKWVKASLLRTMPTFFMGGTASSEQVWNQEGMLRDQDRQQQRTIDELMSDVYSLLSELEGTSTPAAPNVAVLEPTTPIGYPGGGIYNVNKLG